LSEHQSEHVADSNSGRVLIRPNGLLGSATVYEARRPKDDLGSRGEEGLRGKVVFWGDGAPGETGAANLPEVNALPHLHCGRYTACCLLPQASPCSARRLGTAAPVSPGAPSPQNTTFPRRSSSPRLSIDFRGRLLAFSHLGS
jgi:hypothetical protein